MKVGDLIRDPETGDVGILIEIDHESGRHNFVGKPEPYRVLNTGGKAYWFGVKYIENHCEVVK